MNRRITRVVRRYLAEQWRLAPDTVGPWVVTQVGSARMPFVLTRPASSAAAASLQGSASPPRQDGVQLLVGDRIGRSGW